MTGMCAKTGKALDELPHIIQSITNIITTPIGSRLQRRTYGSETTDLIDQPDHSTTRIRIFAAVAYAIRLWEKRVNITKIQIVSLASKNPGQALLQIEGTRTNGDSFFASIPIGGAA